MATYSGNFDTIEHDEYTEYQINSGRMVVILEEGDTFENVLFNQTAPGTEASLVTQATWDESPLRSWVIRNIAWEGVTPSNGNPPLVFACTENATVENIYLGDGDASYQWGSSNYNDQPGAVRSNPTHSGHVDVRNMYVANWVDNALYLSPPGTPGPGGGSFTVENCYVYDNQISCYRLGTDSTIRNCYGKTQPGDHRVMWCYLGGATITIEDCSFDAANPDRAIEFGSGTVANVSGTEYTGTNSASQINDQGGNTITSSPTHFVPDSCPTTAMEALTGEPSDDPDEFTDWNLLDPITPPSTDPYEHFMLFRNLAQEPDAQYVGWLDTREESADFATSSTEGGAETSEGVGIYNDDEWDDLVSFNIATGMENQIRKAIKFHEAEVIALERTGAGQVELDGEAINPAEYDDNPGSWLADEGVDVGDGDDDDTDWISEPGDVSDAGDPPVNMRINGVVWSRPDMMEIYEDDG